MKRTLLLVISAIVAMASYAVDATTSATVQSTQTTQTARVVNKTNVKSEKLKVMSKRMFRQTVWNPNESKKFKYQGTQPIVIDFNATWCKPCKRIAPILEELNAEYAGKVTFYSIDIDKEQGAVPDYPETFGFSSIPTLLIIKPGMTKKPVPHKIGGATKESIKQLIDAEIQ